MLNNIILEIISDKKRRNIEPNHATFKEVYYLGQKQGLSATSIKSGLNELFINGEIEVSNAYQNELLTISTKPLLVVGAVN